MSLTSSIFEEIIRWQRNRLSSSPSGRQSSRPVHIIAARFVGARAHTCGGLACAEFASAKTH